MASEPPIVVWDPAGRLVVIGGGAGGAMRALAVETASRGATVVAAADAGDDAPLSATLPEGARAATLIGVSDAGVESVFIQLDEAFAADGAAAPDDVATIAVRADGGLLGATRGGASVGDGLMATGLNRVSTDRAGQTRVLAGPFLHPSEVAARRATLGVSAEGGRLVAELRRASGEAAADAAAPDIVFAHAPADMRAARRALAGADPSARVGVEAALDALLGRPDGADASGADQVTARRRGFTVLKPTPLDAPGDGVFARLVIEGWGDDDVLVAVPLGDARLGFGDDAAPAGRSPLAIEVADGAFQATAMERASAPARGSELALVGAGSGALTVRATGAPAVATDDVLVEAVKAARALKTAPRRPAASRLTGDWPAAGAGPLRTLTARATAERRSMLGLLLSDEVGEELSERSAEEQAAMLALAVTKPVVAARACAFRLSPPTTADPAFEATLAWFEAPDLPQRIAREAATSSRLDRAGARLLHEVAGSAHRVWTPFETARDARAVLQAAGSAPPLNELDALIDAARRGATGGTGADVALDRLGEIRAGLVAAAGRAGVGETARKQLAKRLLSLAPADILALHGSFERVAKAEAQRTAARDLIARWEIAAGVEGLAAGRGQGGDVLRGAETLVSRGGGLKAELARSERLAPLLDAMRAAIGTAVGADAGLAAETEALRRTLEGYGRLLALHLVRAEADAALARSQPPLDGVASAAAARLRTGVPETLDRYLALASADADVAWGPALAAVKGAA